MRKIRKISIILAFVLLIAIAVAAVGMTAVVADEKAQNGMLENVIEQKDGETDTSSTVITLVRDPQVVDGTAYVHVSHVSTGGDNQASEEAQKASGNIGLIFLSILIGSILIVCIICLKLNRKGLKLSNLTGSLLAFVLLSVIFATIPMSVNAEEEVSEPQGDISEPFNPEDYGIPPEIPDPYGAESEMNESPHRLFQEQERRTPINPEEIFIDEEQEALEEAIYPTLDDESELPWVPPIEPEPEEGNGWMVEGIGTYFEITDSDYLDITFTSSEIVKIRLESIPNVISIIIETACTATSTEVIITGLEPNKTYYRYQDGVLMEEFLTDETGSYCYTQDISSPHHVSIQEIKSTIYIKNDGSIDPSSAPIVQDGDTYTLTADVYDTIAIQKSGIIFEGAGHSILSPPYPEYLNYGIYLYNLTDVSIQNLTMNRCNYGIEVYNCNNIIIINVNITDYSYGIDLYQTQSSSIINCSISEGMYGVHASYSDNNFIQNNCISHLDPFRTSLNRYNISFENSMNMTLDHNSIITNFYSLLIKGNIVDHYIHNIDATNTVNGKPIYYWVNHQNETIPSDAGFVALIISDNIIAEGLTLNNFANGLILINTSNSTIRNLNLYNCNGILLWNSHNNIILGNTILNKGPSGQKGIQLKEANHNDISENTILGDFYESDQLTGSFVTTAIEIESSNNNNINNNTISGCRGGIFLKYSNENFITGNLISKNEEYGINLSDSNNCEISGNTISDTYGYSQGYFYFDETGLILTGSNWNLVNDNVITNNLTGIYIGPGFTSLSASKYNILRNNKMINNSYNIWFTGYSIEDFYNDIDPSNTINGKPVYYLIDCQNVTIPSDASCVVAINSENIIVKDCTISYNNIGILFLNTTDSVIENVNLINNGVGIYLGLNSENNLINTNTVTGSDYFGYSSIQISSSINNILTNNTIKNNYVGGVDLYYSNGTTVENNTISNNYERGVRLYYSNNNQIINNTISENGCDVQQNEKYYGIYTYHSSGNTISNNIISNNTDRGMYIVSGSNNTINNNIFTYNGTYGIHIVGDWCTLIGNMCTNNGYYGIYVDRYNNTLKNNIMENNLYNFGVKLDNYTHDIDTSNTVDGKKIYIWSNHHYENVPSDAGFVALIDSDHITVEDLSLNNNQYGLFVKNSPDSIFQNLDILDNHNSVYFENSPGALLAYNNLIGNQCVPENVIEPDLVNEIHLINSGNTTITNNTISTPILGLRLEYSGNSNIIENIVIGGPTKNSYGIQIQDSNGLIISNNVITEFSYGLDVDSSNCDIIANTISCYYDGTEWGISYRGVYVEGSNCNINGNTISHSYGGIGVKGSYNTINNNTLFDIFSMDCINISYYGNNNTVNNNTIDNIVYKGDLCDGIVLSSSYSTVNNNIVANVHQGIYMWGINNNVEGNTISNCASEGLSFGGEDNLINGNTISGNGTEVYESYGLEIGGTYCTVSNNTILNNKWGGIYLRYMNNIVTNNVISGNGFVDQEYSPSYIGPGIKLDNTSYNIISNNIISENEKGVILEKSDQNIIDNNTIGNNYTDGLHLLSSHNCTLNNNDVFNNDNGIIISNSNTCNLDSNSISNNGGYGVNLDCSYNKLRNNIIEGNTYNFEVTNDSHDIDISNTIDGKPIYYWINRHFETVPLNAGYIAIFNSDYITIEDQILSGILLVGTSHSIINNVEVTNSLRGIFLYDSLNTTVTGCTISNVYWGMYVYYSNNCIINNNIISRGINVYSSEYITINENSVADGISLGYSINGTINNNSIIGNISLNSSSSSIVIENIITNGWIYLYNYSDNSIINNNIISYGDGIYISSNNCTLIGNKINNGNYGILLYGSNHFLRNNILVNNNYNFGVFSDSNDIDISNTVNEKPIYYWVNHHNDIIPSDAGYIAIVNSDTISIQALSFENNYHGICVINSDNITISGLTLSNNYYGLYCENTSNINIYGSIITDGSYGIDLHSCEYINIQGLTITNNYYGILCNDSGFVSIQDIILNNNENGIFFFLSYDSSIINVSIENSLYGMTFSNSYRNIITGNDIFSSLSFPENESTIGMSLRSSALNTISNNTVQGFGTGIDLLYFNNNSFNNNIISNNYLYGIYMINSRDSIISENTITNTYGTSSDNTLAGIGFYLEEWIDDTLCNNTINYNTISDSSENGLLIIKGDSNTLIGNVISNNGENGIFMYDVDSIILKENTISNHKYNLRIDARLEQFINYDIEGSNLCNGKKVLYLRSASNMIFDTDEYSIVYLIECDDIELKNMNLSHNYYGIVSIYSTNCLIENNIISNTYDGISLAFSDGNTISNNTITNTDYTGIVLWSSSQIDIINNTISNNIGTGIMITDINRIPSDYFTICGNLISNNGEYGIIIAGWEAPLEFGYINIDKNIISYNGWGGTYVDFIYYAHIIENMFVNNNYSGLVIFGQYYNVIGNTIYSPDALIIYAGKGSAYVYHNNFIGNISDVTGMMTIWYNKDLEGNYYSEYSGLDNGSNATNYIDLPKVAGDGIGDTDIPIHIWKPYYPIQRWVDQFPLMYPWGTPGIASITGPEDPVPINTEVQLEGVYNYFDRRDTHTALWDWGDNTTSEGIVTEDDGRGTVAGSHTYTEPGVYRVTLTVTDDDDESHSMDFEYVVVYDPSDGFVTGGGWINSPGGAYTPDTTLTGKATFGFVAKYKKGTTEPIGKTEFQFHAADMNFHSDTYEWLVVAGSKAMFKGTGTINGEGEYKFILTAVDGDLKGKEGSPDKFRIKIWMEDEATGEEIIIYDNMPGAEVDEELDETTELGGGEIVIHKG